MKIVSFDEWQQLSEKAISKDEMVNCLRCNGTGEVEHNCDCAFCECDANTCDVCDGAKRIKYWDIPAWARKEYYSKRNYYKAATHDLTALFEWSGSLNTFFENEFTIYATINNRKLILVSPSGFELDAGRNLERLIDRKFSQDGKC